MKNKKTYFIFIPIILPFLFWGIYSFTNNKPNTINDSSNISSSNILLDDSSNSTIEKLNGTKKTTKEMNLSTFSTPLAGDENRLENIRISCETINGTILKNGESFSFNDVIGEPTPEKGYKEADVLVETELSKDYGGGNCQVSTTLYNACLNTPGIEITERHPHKKSVAYVEEGKDASVSYGVLDLKFINNTGSTIKIYMNSENNQVTASIFKII